MESGTPYNADGPGPGASWEEPSTFQAQRSGKRGERAGWLSSELRSCVRTLAAYERPSASVGERKAAEWIAGRLRELCGKAEIEVERAHGGYWWPLGLLNGIAAAAGAAHLKGRKGARRRGPRGGVRKAGAGEGESAAGWDAARLAAAAVGLAAAAAIWDDVGGGRQTFRRLALPKRDTFNVVAEAGDRATERTVVVVAHHDAAHTGLVFHPALPRIVARAFPKIHQRATQSAPIMYATWLGPVMVAAGALLGSSRLSGWGVAFAAGSAVEMADIGRSPVVAGANDNLSAVAVLVAVARALAERPLEGVRAVLLSTGSEESFMEGMQGFVRRHFGELDCERTKVLCLECLGGPELRVLEGEGMLRMRAYDAQTREALAEAAEDVGIPIARGLRTVAATDALVALRRGFKVVTLASVDETKFPANYHWATDIPENLCWETVEGAFAVAERFVRRGGRSSEEEAGAQPSTLRGA